MAISRPAGQLSNLLLECPEAYYWAGFLMADGSINHPTQRLKLSLAIKDVDHLRRFAAFIQFTGNIKYDSRPFEKGSQAFPYCVIAIRDTVSVPQFATKFHFYPNKTHSPPKSIDLNDQELIWFTIGLIDGDGCINKQNGRSDCVIRIKMYRTWLNWLTMLHQRICNIVGVKAKLPHLNNLGYAQLHWANADIMNYLKINSNNLPRLERKWSRIDETRLHNAAKRRAVIKLIRDGLKPSEIKAMGYTYSLAYKIHREING